MTREEFATLVGSRPVILDGATGTNLQKAGMPVGVCPEQWILENPGVLIELQERYVEAGTDILFAPTFTASRIKLEEYGLEDSLVQMNRELVALSKRAAGGRAYVAGDLTMTGRQLYPCRLKQAYLAVSFHIIAQMCAFAVTVYHDITTGYFSAKSPTVLGLHYAVCHIIPV